MAYNGAGTFNRLYNWVNDKNNSIPITASRMDDEMNGFATALSNAICRDGQSTILANIPLSGFKFLNVASATSRNEFASLAQLQDNGVQWCGASGGTANAMTLSPTPAITVYAAGQRFQAVITTANTGAATAAVSGLATKNIMKCLGAGLVSLAPNDMPAATVADFIYDGTQIVLLGCRPFSHGADVPSAATLNLDTATGNYVFVSGTTTITAITLAEGRQCITKFTGIAPITAGASLIPPGGVSFTPALNDVIVWQGEAAGVVRAIGGIKADGTAFGSFVSLNGGQFGGFRNWFVNGDMKVWQRGTSSTTLSTSISYTGSPDRWFTQCNSAASASIAQDTSITAALGFKYDVKIGRNNGNSNTGTIFFGQVMETINSLALAGKQVTLSYYAKAGANYSSSASGLNAVLVTGTGTDQSAATLIGGTWTGASNAINVTDTLTTTFQRFTHTVTLGSTATQIGFFLQYAPTGTAGADDNAYIIGLQLEIGGVATPFEFRPYQTELGMCQRYFEKSFPQATAPAQSAGNTGQFDFVAGKAGALNEWGYVQFKNTKRVTPTITLYNPSAANAQARDVTIGADCSASAAIRTGDNGFAINCAGNASTAVGNELGVHWIADAEF